MHALPIVFLSTLSLRRATSRYTGGAAAIHNFYPRSPCGERRKHQRQGAGGERISIHALLAESDAPKPHLRVPFLISIHALLAESDIFPSGTAPLVRNFYPRSPCGERPLLSRNTLFDTAISIHALLAESDARRIFQAGSQSPFLSTLSLRRATQPLTVI